MGFDQPRAVFNPIQGGLTTPDDDSGEAVSEGICGAEQLDQVSNPATASDIGCVNAEYHRITRSGSRACLQHRSKPAQVMKAPSWVEQDLETQAV